MDGLEEPHAAPLIQEVDQRRRKAVNSLNPEALLGKKTPEQLAAELVDRTKLHVAEERGDLVSNGEQLSIKEWEHMISNSTDPLVISHRLESIKILKRLPTGLG